MGSISEGKWRRLPGEPTGLVPSFTGNTVNVGVVRDDVQNGAQGDGQDKVQGDSVTFTVHEDLLKRSSGFFQRVLGGPWKENVKGSIQLHESSDDALRTYINWLYSGKLVVWADSDNDDWIMPFILSLYHLGTYLLDDPFRNALISSFINHILAHQNKTILNAEFIRQAYAKTNEYDPLRRLVADLAAKQGMLVTREMAHCPDFREFGLDIAVRMLPMTFQRESIIFKTSVPAVCRYHRHPHGETCAGKPFRAGPGVKGRPSTASASKRDFEEFEGDGAPPVAR